MKRIFAALSAFVLILGGCGGNTPAPRIRTVTTVSGSADTALPRQIIFAVDSDADEILISAAENFCRKANSLAKGSFTLTAEKLSNPLAELKSGRASFIFLDGSKAEELHPYFAAANERFRYSSYENFSMTCNSSKVLRRLSDVSRLNVFAAFYTGSNVLAGSGTPDEIIAVKPGGEPDSHAAEVGVFSIPGSGTGEVFDIQGVMAAESVETDERLKMLYSRNRIVELSFAELVTSMIAAAAPETPDNADSLFEAERVVITRTFHSITPTWLILAPSLYESLSPVGRAAISEAAAHIAGDVDEVCLKLEQERLDELNEAGIEISSDFKSTRNKILQLKAEPAEPYLPDENSFRELLGRL